MGIFNKVGGWLANKSDQFIRGGAERESGYYATREAREAYSGMGTEQAMSDEAGEQSERRPALDPFGRGDGDYGGRVPYRSKYDLEMEAYQKAQQQQAQQQQHQQAAQMQAQAQQQAVPNQQSVPMMGGAMPQRAMPQQQAMPQRQNAQAAYPQGFAPPVNNVVPFPGMQRGPDGMVYAHVEYIVLLRSRNECKDVIGYIKTNASVFLNMEFIASDSERQRCVDLLSGAAYTLGCKLNKISIRGIYLISSPSVRVILDGATQRLSGAPEAQGFARQRYEQPASYGGYAPQQQEPPRQRPVTGFSSGSPTTRFQAQGTQRNPPVSFGNVMTGNPQDSGYAAQAYTAQR